MGAAVFFIDGADGGIATGIGCVVTLESDGMLAQLPPPLDAVNTLTGLPSGGQFVLRFPPPSSGCSVAFFPTLLTFSTSALGDGLTMAGVVTAHTSRRSLFSAQLTFLACPA